MGSMKPIVIKNLLLAALILFGVILLMTLVGCVACISGATDDFYCGAFCCAGKVVLIGAGVSIVFFVIRAILRRQ